MRSGREVKQIGYEPDWWAKSVSGVLRGGNGKKEKRCSLGEDQAVSETRPKPPDPPLRAPSPVSGWPQLNFLLPMETPASPNSSMARTDGSGTCDRCGCGRDLIQSPNSRRFRHG